MQVGTEQMIIRGHDDDHDRGLDDRVKHIELDRWLLLNYIKSKSHESVKQSAEAEL